MKYIGVVSRTRLPAKCKTSDHGAPMNFSRTHLECSVAKRHLVGDSVISLSEGSIRSLISLYQGLNQSKVWVHGLSIELVLDIIGELALSDLCDDSLHSMVCFSRCVPQSPDVRICLWVVVTAKAAPPLL
jgi:hypothetical protein